MIFIVTVVIACVSKIEFRIGLLYVSLTFWAFTGVHDCLRGIFIFSWSFIHWDFYHIIPNTIENYYRYQSKRLI